MKLIEYAERYRQERNLNPQSRHGRRLLAHCREFAEFAGNLEATTYSRGTVNAWAEIQEAAGHTSRTIEDKLNNIVTVLRSAVFATGTGEHFGQLKRNRLVLHIPVAPNVVVEPPPATDAPATTNTPLTLLQWLDAYLLERDLRPNTIVQLKNTCCVFARFLGGSPDPSLSELTAQNINRFAVWQERTHRRPKTIKTRVGNLRALARAADATGLIGPLGAIRCIRVPRQVVRAPTPAEVLRLLAATKSLKRVYSSGLPSSKWWDAFVRLNWDTGLRPSDMLALRFSDLRENRTVSVTQQKTGQVLTCQLSAETWHAVEAIRRPRRELILPWHGRREAFAHQFRALAKRAGLSDDVTPKYLRRGGATQIWKRHGPTAAARYLGHTDLTGGTAQRSYIDQSQLFDTLLPPPPLLATSEKGAP